MANNGNIRKVRAGQHQWTGGTCLRYWADLQRLIACIPSRTGRVALSYENITPEVAAAVFADPKPVAVISTVVEPLVAPSVSMCANCPPEGCARHKKPTLRVYGPGENAMHPARLPLVTAGTAEPTLRV
jgi:hypothetical protein